MPKEKIQHLITDLHDRFGDELSSGAQQELMNQLNSHIHDMDTAAPADPEMIDTVEALVNEVEAEHPAAAGVLKQVLDILKNIGV